MSITGLPDTDKIHKKSFHRWNDSGELDVFEAARYFSGANEVSAGYNGAPSTCAQKVLRSGGRISLDVPMRNSIPPQNLVMEKQMMKEKKYKQPSSPGGRLASFLNSLFNQTSLKKKKSKSTTQSMKEEDESPGGRRKRRSSISHFRSSSHTDSKSIYSSTSSGFRTPPPYAHTPTKTYKDLRSYSDHKQKVSLSNYNNNGHVKSTVVQSTEVCQDKRGVDHVWLDEKFNFSNGFSEKHKNFVHGFSEKVRIQADKFPSEEKEFGKFDEIDDGADSDSSSDLFELQNYDLGYYSSGLPVYETTHMDSIKRGAPISSGPI
ncbi:protein BIG GRAIN 1-like E [Cornus florida]|uniref:protein BIG GRAIN 1-like E n=1 Tax=Cornus florida TaxID=4283 RepID=UPI0028A0C34F|nr:protein BIG GRAIN 1-like E [Cornus florida]